MISLRQEHSGDSGHRSDFDNMRKSSVNGKQIRVIFRYDDCSSISSVDTEAKLIDAFRRFGVPCTFGIIPCVSAKGSQGVSLQKHGPIGAAKAEILKEAIGDGIIEVAQHGYSHDPTGKADKGRPAEFAGLSCESQREKIVKGQDLLQQVLDTKMGLP